MADTEVPAVAEREPVSSVPADQAVPASNPRGSAGVERSSAPDSTAAPAQVIPPEQKAEPVKNAPLREIAVRLAGNTDAPVDLRIAEDRGKLHVEVRTSDPELASSLRDNVGDLVQKLDRTGYRAESVSTHEQVRSAAATTRQDSDNGGQPGGQGGGQTGQGHQHGHGRGNRPRWLEEIVKNFQAGVQEQEDEN